MFTIFNQDYNIDIFDAWDKEDKKNERVSFYNE